MGRCTRTGPRRLPLRPALQHARSTTTACHPAPAVAVCAPGAHPSQCAGSPNPRTGSANPLPRTGCPGLAGRHPEAAAAVSWCAWHLPGCGGGLLQAGCAAHGVLHATGPPPPQPCRCCVSDGRPVSHRDALVRQYACMWLQVSSGPHEGLRHSQTCRPGQPGRC